MTGAERSPICRTSAMTSSIILLIILTALSQNRVTGFRMKLIPIDSPESPLATTLSPTAEARHELLANISLARALRHTKRTPPLPIHLQAPILGGLSFINYFITPLQLGTDAGSFTAHVVLDTGSPDLWIQSQSCNTCINVKGGSFNPNASPSYLQVSFQNDALCRPRMQWRDTGACMYRVSYGGGQSTSGPVGTDVLFFEDATGNSGEFFFVALRFGLENRNFRFDQDSENVISGVLGLSLEEPRSFMYQVRETAKYRFSYCLPLPGRDSESSMMYFGVDANATGPGWQTMPMLSDGNSYHLYLEGISVNSTLLPIDDDVFEYNYQRQRAFYIDIGSPFTFLERSAYEELILAMTHYFAKLGIDVSRPWWPPYGPYHQCYATSLASGQQYPSVRLHFHGGAKLFLGSDTLFTPHLSGFCVAIFPTSGPSLLGAWQQANHQFLFDIEEGVIAFAPRNCLGVN